MTRGCRRIAEEASSALKFGAREAVELPGRRAFAKGLLSSVLLSLATCFVFIQTSPSHAVDEPAATHATRLILLGTAAGPGVVRLRSEPANLLVVDGTPYLIDAGESVTRQLVLAGFQPARMRTIFITHHHVDHDAGLEPLISLEWFGRSFAPSEAPAEIYGPPATKYLVGTALDYLSVSERIFRAGIPHMLPAKPMFEAHDIDHDGVVFQDNNVKVTAVENTHFSFKSETPDTGQDRSYAYRFDTKSGSVVFTGDTGPSRAVTKLAEGADVLVSEVRAPAPPTVTATAAPPAPGQAANPAVAELMNHLEHEHLVPEEVGKMAARAHVKVVVLTHISPSTETDMTKFTAGVKKYFSGIVIPGSDFFEYDLD
jgi:ribonuclease BN (tRNA processing enzyme)